MAKVELFDFSRPPFLASEVGLVLKTATVYPSDATEEDGRLVVYAGKVLSNRGILFEEIDLTDVPEGNGVECPVMVGGWVYPNIVDGDISAFKGIHTCTEGEVERPYKDAVAGVV